MYWNFICSGYTDMLETRRQGIPVFMFHIRTCSTVSVASKPIFKMAPIINIIEHGSGTNRQCGLAILRLPIENEFINLAVMWTDLAQFDVHFNSPLEYVRLTWQS
jgi:hypothetical protein